MYDGIKPKTVDKLVKVLNGLKCFYTNADSLPNKLDEFKVRAQEVDEGYDIIAITEVYTQKIVDFYQEKQSCIYKDMNYS